MGNKYYNILLEWKMTKYELSIPNKNNEIHYTQPNSQC